MRLLSLQQTLARVGIPRATYYVMRNRGEFPEPLVINQRSIAYPSTVIDEWIRQHRGERAA